MCRFPERKQTPKVSLQGRNSHQFLPAGAPPAGNGGPLGTASPSSLFPGTGAPTPPGQPGSSRSVQREPARSRNPGHCRSHSWCIAALRSGWPGGGEGTLQKREHFSPSLPQPLQRLASDYVCFAGHEARGPVPVRFLLHLRRQCLLAPCAAHSRSLGRRRRPMQQPHIGAGREARAAPGL